MPQSHARAQRTNFSTPCGLVAVLVIAALWHPATLLANAPPTGEDIERQIELEQARRGAAVAQLNRAEVLAGLSRDIVRFVELKRRAAADERSQLEVELEAKRIVVEQHTWALNQFEPAATGKIDQPQIVGRVMKRWDTVRQRAKDRYLNFPEQVRGEIASGRALNYFLDVCGPTAVMHDMQRQQLISQIALLEASPANSTGANARQDVQRQLAAAREELEMLRTFETYAILEPNLTRHLRAASGLRGEKPVIRLGETDANQGAQSVLPLEWPTLLIRHGQFEPHRQKLENTRDEALAQLRHGTEGLTPETQIALIAAVDELCAVFEDQYRRSRAEFRQKYLSAPQGAGDQLTEWILARRYLAAYRAGVARLLSAQMIDDVTIPAFTGRSVSELLNFMSQHGLRFAGAEPNDEAAYHRVFQGLVTYHRDLTAFQVALGAKQQEIEQIESRVDQLFNVQYDNLLDYLVGASLVPLMVD